MDGFDITLNAVNMKMRKHGENEITKRQLMIVLDIKGKTIEAIERVNEDLQHIWDENRKHINTGLKGIENDR